MILRTCCAAATFAAGATAATAGTLLQLDINTIQAQSLDTLGGAGAFGGVSHTGAIRLTAGPASTLTDVLLNGASQNVAPNQLTTFVAMINLVNGQVSGGQFDISLVGGETFSASVVNGVGQVNTQAGEGFRIDGLLTTAVFSDPIFGGVDISPWFSGQPLDGAFINFAFNPNASGFDGNTNVDIFLVPGAPAASTLALGLAGFAGRRRR